MTPSPSPPSSLNIVAIIQARMSSSRLPGKVLRDIDGRPMLAWVVERTRRAGQIDAVVVATTTNPSDDPIAEFCAAQGYAHTRGDVYDVLDRYYQAARQFDADVIVRITADCPLIDPQLIDKTVLALWGNWKISILGTENQSLIPNLPIYQFSPIYHFVTNRLPPPWGRTYPIGLDVEVFRFESLARAWSEATEKYQREHVTPYFYEGVPVEDLQFAPHLIPAGTGTSPRGFEIALLHHQTDLGHHRWTVDTAEDLQLVREIVSRFPDDTFTWLDILSLFEREPELAQINARVQHKSHRDVDKRNKKR
ncbi:MAG: glycosyltransferase family protein [Chloroflexota bacterium]|nr:glycosyltransferase family protein [Chloroflexota bacterium]